MYRPKVAIVAVTMKCNAKCIMCDIWKSSPGPELEAHEYSKLPASLADINITGGEPFLRKDLPEVIAAVKKAAPQARILISTNGFLTKKIEKTVPSLLEIDPKIAVRVSLDGIQTHDEIRGIPGAFDKAMGSVGVLKAAGVKDLGIAMTLMENNLHEIDGLYELSKEKGIEFTVSVVSESSIFFGDGKAGLSPKDRAKLREALNSLAVSELRSWHPKKWFRGWFEKEQFKFMQGGGRPFGKCDAGEGFFYLDPGGTVYVCHLLNLSMGDIRTDSWDEMENRLRELRPKIEHCHKCLMTCTAKAYIRNNILSTAAKVVGEKARAHLTGRVIH